MVSSCLPAMSVYLDWCIKNNRFFEIQEEIDDDAEDDGELKSSLLDPALKTRLQNVLTKAKEFENSDSKYDQFLLLLGKILKNPETPQIIVFSFFVRTIEYLKKRLEDDGFTVKVIHGGVPLESHNSEVGRYEIMDAFKRGEFQVLLSSEVGGEGLDFQFCHAIMNYDLPYNPMRIEQRIGRIDRFGQNADKIIVANLFITKTVDEEIYDRVYRRIRLVEDGIGTFEPILGKELANIQTEIITGTLTNEQREILSQRLEQSIVSAKMEMEEFEKHRGELLSDDYLAKPINNILKQSFISPLDAIEFTSMCVSNWENCRFLRTRDGCGELKLSAKVVDKIEQFLRRPGNERGYAELETLLTPGNSIKVVFDGSIAENYGDHIFLPPTGYWTRFLIRELVNDKKIRRVFSFPVSSADTNIPGGNYLIFLFEVRLEGLRHEIEFLGIPIDVQTGRIVDLPFDNLPRMLVQIDGQEKCLTSDDVDINLLLEKTRDYLDKVLEKRRSDVSQENQFIIDSRIAALTKSSEMKLRNLENRKTIHIEKHREVGQDPDETYLRLTDGQIEKEKVRLTTKIEELQNHRDLSVDYSLEAIVHINAV
jgi:hypothetical protein